MDGLWLTIDINGLSIVLVEVNGGSQKKAKTQKKHDLLKKKQRGKQNLGRLTWSNVKKVSPVNHFSSLLAL